MAYEDDRDMELDRQLYEEDPAYEADTYFGERLGESSDMSDDEAELNEYEDDTAGDEATFGEAITPSDASEMNRGTAGPASDDSAKEEPEHESMMDKVKDKIDDLTHKDER